MSLFGRGEIASVLCEKICLGFDIPCLERVDMECRGASLATWVGGVGSSEGGLAATGEGVAAGASRSDLNKGDSSSSVSKKS